MTNRVKQEISSQIDDKSQQTEARGTPETTTPDIHENSESLSFKVVEVFLIEFVNSLTIDGIQHKIVWFNWNRKDVQAKVLSPIDGKYYYLEYVKPASKINPNLFYLYESRN